MNASSSRSNQPVNIHIIDPATTGKNRPPTDWIAESAQTVLDSALSAEYRDDRFHSWKPGPDLIAAVAEADGEPIAYLGGTVDRERLQLDGLLAASRAAGADGQMLLAALYHALERSIAASGAKTIELWGKPAESWHRALANREGFDELRSLHQLRCTLPLDVPTLETRPFVPGQDEELLLRVNNRAFASHPDQGNMSLQDLENASNQAWFDPDGIRLYQDPDDPEHLAGFCWTKIHEPLSEGQPRLGEIYAIGIDPDHHGKGLGKPMTAAGLSWLVDQGLTTGMLYVEADNEPALRTYYKLGFERHRTDTAWQKRA
ncbi:MAG: mycothiol synthase [Acidimicrobiales bacterium]